jgi:3-phosphoshikimate 1-carboxyvinyltransferase
MIRTVRGAARLEGTVTLPGDKSISQRAILLNSIASGSAHVSNLCHGDDRASILNCMRGLGVEITAHANCAQTGAEECFLVEGRGPDGLSEPGTVLDAGNSGTATRLVAGLLAAQPFFSVLTGDESLRARPMDRIIGPLSEMGAHILGRDGDSYAPLAIRGGELSGIAFDQPVASAQVKSSVLIAGIHADGETTVVQPAESRDHTERMLHAMGAKIAVEGMRVSVRRSNLSPIDVAVPGDISGAAFWMVAACVHPDARVKIRDVGINPTRAGVLDALRSMGANIRLENVREIGDEPVADIVAESSRLEGIEISGDAIPRSLDELPVLAAAASLASGTTTIRDAAELRIKESDRIAATVAGLSSLGADIEERPDGMIIRGVDSLKGAPSDSAGDHRIAMTMAVAGLAATGETTIAGAEAADVSYPGFWQTLDSLTP